MQYEYTIPCDTLPSLLAEQTVNTLGMGTLFWMICVKSRIEAVSYIDELIETFQS